MAFRRTIKNIVVLLPSVALLLVFSLLMLAASPFRRARIRPSLAGTRRSSSNLSRTKQKGHRLVSFCFGGEGEILLERLWRSVAQSKT